MDSQKNNKSAIVTTSASLLAQQDDRSTMSVMKDVQGLGAALKYGVELEAAKKIKRLPFLRSSHLMEDVLRGEDGPTIDAGNAFAEFQLDEQVMNRSMFLN